MPRRTITDDQRDKVFAMREAGAKYVEIKAATGVSISGATWLCVQAGVEHPTKAPRFLPPGRPAFTRGGHTIRPYTAEEDALIQRLRRRRQLRRHRPRPQSPALPQQRPRPPHHPGPPRGGGGSRCLTL